MSALLGLSLNLLGFALLGITQAKQRRQVQSYFGGTTAHCLRLTGYLMVAAGAAYLIGMNTGALGIVIWFGWHPLMIIGVALMAGLQFSCRRALYLTN